MGIYDAPTVELPKQIDNGIRGLAAYSAYKTFEIANQLGIFDVIEEPKSSEELIYELTLAKEGRLERVLQALRSSGLLEPHGHRYVRAANPQQTIAALMNEAQMNDQFNGLRPLTDISADRLAAILKREMGAIDPTECLPQFDAFMGSRLITEIRRTVAKVVSKELMQRKNGEKKETRVLVLGGGTGYDLYVYANEFPHAKITAIRNKEFLQQSRIIEDVFQLENITNVSWNEIDQLSEKHDIVILDIMSEFSPGIKNMLLRTKEILKDDAKLIGIALTATSKPIEMVFAGINGYLGIPSRDHLLASLRVAEFTKNFWIEKKTRLFYGATRAV